MCVEGGGGRGGGEGAGAVGAGGPEHGRRRFTSSTRHPLPQRPGSASPHSRHGAMTPQGWEMAAQETIPLLISRTRDHRAARRGCGRDLGTPQHGGSSRTVQGGGGDGAKQCHTHAPRRSDARPQEHARRAEGTVRQQAVFAAAPPSSRFSGKHGYLLCGDV